MPRLSKIDLLRRFADSMNACGWAVTFPPPPQLHPFELYLSTGNKTFGVLLYIWNISHGGNHRPADEFRIQITGVESIDSRPGLKTVILGYRDDPPVFAGWDIRFHGGEVAYSPSLQIKEAYLGAANQSGFAACPKGQGEVAIAFRPDLLPTYLENLEGLHTSGDIPLEVDILSSVAETEGSVDEAELASIPFARQSIVRQVAEKVRDASFRQRVLTAYGFRCAMCGTQLDLVDAAHIVPVSDDRSSDETSNGISLCALHHRAFDRALVGVMPDYAVRVNDGVMARLRALDRTGGEASFTRALYRSIHLPPERRQRPLPALLQTGLEARGWTL